MRTQLLPGSFVRPTVGARTGHVRDTREEAVWREVMRAQHVVCERMFRVQEFGGPVLRGVGVQASGLFAPVPMVQISLKERLGLRGQGLSGAPARTETRTC
jgi:hypothetical protein